MWDGLLAGAAPPEQIGAFNMMLQGKTARFDGFSHSSGNQRGYMTCCMNRVHGSCYKYRYVKDFSSHRHLAAWLFAWDLGAGDSGCKAAHLRYEPRPEAVQRILTALPL